MSCVESHGTDVSELSCSQKNYGYRLFSVINRRDKHHLKKTFLFEKQPSQLDPSLPGSEYKEKHNVVTKKSHFTSPRASRLLSCVLGRGGDNSTPCDLHTNHLRPSSPRKSLAPPRHLEDRPPFELFPDVAQVIRLPHFWGCISYEKAAQVLQDLPSGSFLIRESTDREHNFTVSFRRFGRTLHARIAFKNAKRGSLSIMFEFDDHRSKAFKSLPELLAHYSVVLNARHVDPLCARPVSRPNPLSLQELCRASIYAQLEQPRAKMSKTRIVTGLRHLFSGDPGQPPIDNSSAVRSIERLRLPNHLISYLQHYQLKIAPSPSAKQLDGEFPAAE